MCCGNGRQQFHGTRTTARSGVGGRPVAGQPRRQTVVYFEYVGATGLSAVGAATGVRYRFDAPGAVVAADSRDRRSLAGVPQLREVSGP